MSSHDKKIARLKRQVRVRKKVRGTSARPRLNVFKSAKHIYAQLIDDKSGVTVASASSLDKELKGSMKSGSNIDAATAVGEAVGRRAIERTI